MATEVGAGSKHTLAGREYLDSLLARLLMEFQNYIFSPTYITLIVILNAGKFLDHEWVDTGVLREFIRQPAQIPAPTRQQRVNPSLIRVAMRALHEGGREVFELLSDSEPEADDGDSDLEVMEALQRTARSSSAIPLPDPEQFLGHSSDKGFRDSKNGYRVEKFFSTLGQTPPPPHIGKEVPTPSGGPRFRVMCGLTATTLTASKSKPKMLRPISVDSTATKKAFEVHITFIPPLIQMLNAALTTLRGNRDNVRAN
ncbi:hypothetical protein DFH09DRAFT_1071134 [Mycena vulgaris]|nr:hypothetical protein DFH09DRAFT_1071134 [Mycena vulgaris]